MTTFVVLVIYQGLLIIQKEPDEIVCKAVAEMAKVNYGPLPADDAKCIIMKGQFNKISLDNGPHSPK